MPRQQRPSDFADAAIKAMSNAAKPAIHPPAHIRMSEAAPAYWAGVVRSRARDEWSDVDQVLGAHPAQCQAHIEAESELLRTEGTVLAGHDNPGAAVVDMLIRRQLAQMRALRMGGMAAGDPRDLLARRKIERQARQARVEVEGDGLLAL